VPQVVREKDHRHSAARDLALYSISSLEGALQSIEDSVIRV
jgi:hypothetical protein